MIVRKQATLDRIEGKQAVLSLENGQELLILKEELGAATEGDRFTVQIMPDHEATLEKESLARELLNQLLNEESGKAASTEESRKG